MCLCLLQLFISVLLSKYNISCRYISVYKYSMIITLNIIVVISIHLDKFRIKCITFFTPQNCVLKQYFELTRYDCTVFRSKQYPSW